MAAVVFDDVSKVYDGGVRAVAHLSLEARDAEFMVLVGPSGCGKTTALRMVAGLEDISEGELRIGDRAVNDVPARDRDVAMVFQSYALYPHLTVGENIGFGLKLRKVPKDEIRARVVEAARILGLEEFLDRKPRALSGGQRQRVAMGRAIVRRPQAFLMDEPLSNLDAKLRVQMRAEIARLQRDLSTTTVYVTHDQTEAMTLGDRVAVMRKGNLEQVDHPQTLYDHPVNLFVAGFIGSPAMNMLPGRLSIEEGRAVVAIGDEELEIDRALISQRPGLRDYHGREVVVGIRPEDMQDAALVPDHPAKRRLRSKVDLVEALGSELYVHFTLDVPAVITEETKELAADAGGTAMEKIEQQAQELRAEVVARFDPHSRTKRGERVEAAVDTARLHFFDPRTGLAIEGSA